MFNSWYTYIKFIHIKLFNLFRAHLFDVIFFHLFFIHYNTTIFYYMQYNVWSSLMLSYWRWAYELFLFLINAIWVKTKKFLHRNWIWTESIYLTHARFYTCISSESFRNGNEKFFFTTLHHTKWIHMGVLLLVFSQKWTHLEREKAKENLSNTYTNKSR